MEGYGMHSWLSLLGGFYLGSEATACKLATRFLSSSHDLNKSAESVFVFESVGCGIVLSLFAIHLVDQKLFLFLKNWLFKRVNKLKLSCPSK